METDGIFVAAAFPGRAQASVPLGLHLGLDCCVVVVAGQRHLPAPWSEGGDE
jgi:hypothetical protein